MKKKRPSIKRIGEIHGKLTVIAIDPDDAQKVICRCECGTVKTLYYTNIKKTGTKRVTQSCGCHRESGDWCTTTIMDVGLHNTWRGMKQRCTLESHIEYPRYGGSILDMVEEA